MNPTTKEGSWVKHTKEKNTKHQKMEKRSCLETVKHRTYKKKVPR
jgi:hypothetical protein